MVVILFNISRTFMLIKIKHFGVKLQLFLNNSWPEKVLLLVIFYYFLVHLYAFQKCVNAPIFRYLCRISYGELKIDATFANFIYFLIVSKILAAPLKKKQSKIALLQVIHDFAVQEVQPNVLRPFHRWVGTTFDYAKKQKNWKFFQKFALNY